MENVCNIKKVNEYLDNALEEMLEDLRKLISIKSVVSEEEVNAPFGKGVDQAYECMLEMGRKAGFIVKDVDRYGGHLDFPGIRLDSEGRSEGPGEKIMGILCHLDVVPEGGDWDFPPYEGVIFDGKLYGRGAIDDKGPCIAAFYAMKALKETGIVPEHTVRLVLGLDEEVSWKGMEYYKAKVEMPDFAIVPDADFPVIHGEMGIIVCDLVKKFRKTHKTSNLSLKKISGGNAPNMVPDYAEAMLYSEKGYDAVKEIIQLFNRESGYNVESKGRGKSLFVSCSGRSAHGAMPEKGRNAISILMELLGNLNFDNEDVNDFIQFYNRNIGFSLHGENMGCGLEDEVSGKLIFNVGMIQMDEESGKLTINIRYPVTAEVEDVYRGMRPVLEKGNIGVVKTKHQAPIYIPQEDELVQTLMSVYQKYTGDHETKPLVIGGGTYARTINNALGFGLNMPGDIETAHQKNEYIKVENLILSAKIYAEAIYHLAKCRMPQSQKE